MGISQPAEAVNGQGLCRLTVAAENYLMTVAEIVCTKGYAIYKVVRGGISYSMLFLCLITSIYASVCPLQA